MALVKLNYRLVLGGVIEKLREYGIQAFDAVEMNQPAPFCFVEIVSVEAANSKTSKMDKYRIWIHAFADSSQSSIPILDLCQAIEESLSEDIQVPEPYWLVSQDVTGLNTLFTESEKDEKHAVIELAIKVCYGFESKV